jgi:hypothetical protein
VKNIRILLALPRKRKGKSLITGRFVLWSFGPFVLWSFGPLVVWSFGHSVIRSFGQPRLYRMDFRGKVSRNTLANANEKRDWRIYADFAQALIRIAQPLYAEDDFGVELENTVYALGSTAIDLCLSLFPWARFRKRKGAVKVHTLIDLRGNIPCFVSIKATLAHQGFFRNVGEPCENSNLDCDFSLRACRDPEKALVSRFEPLHNSTDFELDVIRESSFAANTYGNGSHNRDT